MSRARWSRKIRRAKRLAIIRGLRWHGFSSVTARRYLKRYGVDDNVQHIMTHEHRMEVARHEALTQEEYEAYETQQQQRGGVTE